MFKRRMITGLTLARRDFGFGHGCFHGLKFKNCARCSTSNSLGRRWPAASDRTLHSFRRKPYWWPSAEEWDKTFKRYDIRFDINAKEPPYFWVANAAIRKVKNHQYVPLS